MAESWDKEEFEKLAKFHLELGVSSGSMHAQLRAFFGEAFAHYEGATAEGKAFVDGMMVKMVGIFDLMLEAVPDTADARKMRRMIGLAKGKLPQAKNLISHFQILADDTDKRIDEAKGVLCNTLQCLLDIMHDATQKSHSGVAKVSNIGLFYWLVDELVAAQYLARRGYSTQAYTHLRISLEILDKIESFTRFPELAEVWGSGNDKEIFEKLAPPRVREKLGRDSRDPMYKYFSEQGSHATFTAMQPRLRGKQHTPADDMEIGITVGGRKEPARQISILIYCILVTTQAIIKAATAFEDRLNAEDVTQLVTSATNDCFGFFGRFLDSIDRSKDDVAPLETILASWQEMREKGQL